MAERALKRSPRPRDDTSPAAPKDESQEFVVVMKTGARLMIRAKHMHVHLRGDLVFSDQDPGGPESCVAAVAVIRAGTWDLAGACALIPADAPAAP